MKSERSYHPLVEPFMVAAFLGYGLVFFVYFLVDEILNCAYEQNSQTE